MTTDRDKRLIEDYLPIQVINAEGARKGHISTLHLWWARRPLVACRAAVYGALVPVTRFAPNGASGEKKKSLSRANAAKFVERLCQYPGSPTVIAEAQVHVLEAHAERLTQETGKKVAVEDIENGRAPRPKVLDMFAGGGAIPLEASRLGCQAYALDLNPVAHIIELCTLVYPQKYGRLDPNVRGMTGPKNAQDETTWGGLANEVRYWGNWVLEKVKAAMGDLYPLIPDPEFKGKKTAVQANWLKEHATDDVPPGYLRPVAYLWTRTVTCKNPHCAATVPLLKQTWLCRKQDRYVALKMVAPKGKKQVRFEVVEAKAQSALGFDPEAGSKAGNAICLFCGTVADSDYVMQSGIQKRFDEQLMTVVCRRPDSTDWNFVQPEEAEGRLAAFEKCSIILGQQCNRLSLGIPDETIDPTRPSPNARGLTAVTRYGLHKFSDLFTLRQLVFLMEIAIAVKSGLKEMSNIGCEPELNEAVGAYLGLFVSRSAQTNTTMARWRGDKAGRVEGAFGRHALTMIWDFPEMNPFGGLSNDAWGNFAPALDVIEANSGLRQAVVMRGTATSIPAQDALFDAVVTDPPYYDNVPYADISDFFYVWLRRAIGDLFPEHFASALTPKKTEATALSSRHGGDMVKAAKAYEGMMAAALREAHRTLKGSGELVLVYAHKTTLGWVTLIDALRVAGFMVIEAWPLDTEMGTRLSAMKSAALASSIFIVARKRDVAAIGKYEEEVRTELEQTVRERVGTLWEMGISGADLVIACVGAGLQAFTRFSRVEYANGVDVPAERFLVEVETVVLETILARLSKEVGANGGGKHSLVGLDAATRFYVLWRYTYKSADLDSGEAIIFANGTHVELDGTHGLSSGVHALVAKNKSKYRLLDFTERGDDEKLGLPDDGGQPARMIDTLHRTLWLMENRPALMAEYLRQGEPNRDQMRLVAQALAGPALRGGEMADVSTSAEQSALAKLTANWRGVVEDAVVTTTEKEAKKTGQRSLDYEDKRKS